VDRRHGLEIACKCHFQTRQSRGFNCATYVSLSDCWDITLWGNPSGAQHLIAERCQRPFALPSVNDVKLAVIMQLPLVRLSTKNSAASAHAPTGLPHVGQAVAAAHLGTTHSQGTRQRMSAAHKRRRTLVPGTVLWTPDDGELVQTWPIA
jgi:hypothetical protein